MWRVPLTGERGLLVYEAASITHGHECVEVPHYGHLGHPAVQLAMRLKTRPIEMARVIKHVIDGVGLWSVEDARTGRSSAISSDQIKRWLLTHTPSHIAPATADEAADLQSAWARGQNRRGT